MRNQRRVSPAMYRTQDRYRATRPHRSWAKSALIIGGSAGTGAGIGGIVNGKKGALIGAARGGGVASLYEGAHRHETPARPRAAREPTVLAT